MHMKFYQLYDSITLQLQAAQLAPPRLWSTLVTHQIARDCLQSFRHAKRHSIATERAI